MITLARIVLAALAVAAMWYEGQVLHEPSPGALFGVAVLLLIGALVFPTEHGDEQ